LLEYFETNCFERHRLITELHFGQLQHACQQLNYTILKGALSLWVRLIIVDILWNGMSNPLLLVH
jgi:hypothetical protein